MHSFFRPDTENMPCVKHTVLSYLDMMRISKSTFASQITIFGPQSNLTSPTKIDKSCVQCQLRKCSGLKKCPFILCLLRTCPMSEFMSTFLDLSKLQNTEKSTFFVSLMLSQNTPKLSQFQKKKQPPLHNPFLSNCSL